jgi:hypothetical protein
MTVQVAALPVTIGVHDPPPVLIADHVTLPPVSIGSHKNLRRATSSATTDSRILAMKLALALSMSDVTTLSDTLVAKLACADTVIEAAASSLTAKAMLLNTSSMSVAFALSATVPEIPNLPTI